MSSPTITRRKALATLAGAALAAIPLARAATTSDSRTAMPPAPAANPPSGRLHHSVCKWCYPGIPLAALAGAARDLSLESIELLEPAEWPVVRQAGLVCAMANGTTTIADGFNRLEHHGKYVPSMIERIKACAEAGLPNVICFSGNRGGLPDEQGLENCATGLKQIAGAAEKAGVTVCMELLNSRVDHPDYQCDHTAWGVELVKRRVGSERFKLLYDIYHMQIMEGDVIRTIQDNHAFILSAAEEGAHAGVPAQIAHLRPRSNLFGAMFRLRSRLAFAVHQFFQERDFVYVHTPIITASDCEGAGEMFRVTTLKGNIDEKPQADFFGKPAYLTVSGQLEARRSPARCPTSTPSARPSARRTRTPRATPPSSG
jgi:hydroxypyruvate isomerase